MPKINVDGLEYNTEDLTDFGLSQLDSIRFLENQVEKIQREIKVLEDAREIYLKAQKSLTSEAQ